MGQGRGERERESDNERKREIENERERERERMRESEKKRLDSIKSNVVYNESQDNNLCWRYHIARNFQGVKISQMDYYKIFADLIFKD